MIRNGAVATASSGSGSVFYSGAVEPSKSLDTSVLAKLKAGDEFYVLPTSGTPSAGTLFVCLDPTAGAAKWRPVTAIVQMFDGPAAGTSGYLTQTVNFPMGASMHDIEGIGTGGGAGAGGVFDAGVAAYGGDGGDSGYYGAFRLTAADLGSLTSAKILMYPPGTGAAAQSTNSTAGTNGNNGGKTRFQLNGADVYLWNPGQGGKGGSNAVTTQTALTGANVFFAQGGHNLATHLTQAAANSNGGFKGGVSGAAGGCIDTSNNHRAGGSGYGTYDNVTTGNAGGAAGGANGNNGVAPTYAGSVSSGTAPSGGGANTGGNGGDGGNGVGPGQGGAGSGAARNGYKSGTPGNGAPSRVVMISRP